MNKITRGLLTAVAVSLLLTLSGCYGGYGHSGYLYPSTHFSTGYVYPSFNLHYSQFRGRHHGLHDSRFRGKHRAHRDGKRHFKDGKRRSHNRFNRRSRGRN